MPLQLAISPCPNDTFVFHALVHGLVPGAPPVEVTYADIDVTNIAAEQGHYDLVKVSYAALPWLGQHYQLLPAGGAVGRGCGPLVVVKDAGAPVSDNGALPEPNGGLREPNDEPRQPNGARREPQQELAGRTVAVPSERSTAYLLLRLWAAACTPAPRFTVVPFNQIMPGVAAGEYDAGLVIHEARFTYQRYGLAALIDLGEWWERDTGLPIPLGAIMARRGRVDPAAASEWIRTSVSYAMANPQASQEYVLRHAQEMQPEVVRQHIALYVNDFTLNLGDEGWAAVCGLLDRAERAGLVPAWRDAPGLRVAFERPAASD